MQNRWLYRVAFWVGSLCLIRVLAVVTIAQRERILQAVRSLVDWMLDPNVVLWVFLVLAVGLLIGWERLSPTRSQRR